jgi:hypothetical protein
MYVCPVMNEGHVLCPAGDITDMIGSNSSIIETRGMSSLVLSLIDVFQSLLCIRYIVGSLLRYKLQRLSVHFLLIASDSTTVIYNCIKLREPSITNTTCHCGGFKKTINSSYHVCHPDDP